MEPQEYESMDRLERDHWWFKAKRRFLRLVLQKNSMLRPDQTARALDVGCGTGAVLEELQSLGFQVQGLDMSPLAQMYCQKKGLSVRLGEAGNLPFADGSFDVVTALDVVEHVDQDEQVVKELYRVVKPGGLVIITVPAHQSLWSYHDVALHHKRRYSKSSFTALVGKLSTSVRVGWIHASILPGVFLVRGVNRLLSQENTVSDVQETSWFISCIMSVPYLIEYAMFRFWGTLPWGVSLIATIRRPL